MLHQPTLNITDHKPDTGPRIPIHTRWINGKLMIGSVQFTPGMVIERCGRKYTVDKHGTQRRVKE